MQKLLYGAAYYDEYMPYDRLEQDIQMMKKARINTVRIAESTWSSYEPKEGVFDFSHVERVLNAMEQAGIGVIIGTPTYAIPPWMAKAHPEILAVTAKGRNLYGPRQNMDITHPAYRFYAERIIRKLLEKTAHRKCVIGFQLDNETKYYDTAGKNVQEKFVKYLRLKFHDDLDALNREFGLDYWSNAVHAWEDFPDVRGTVNGSLGAEFEKFRRTLVEEFLAWQAGIVKEYCREGQFITHNFDFEWRGYSYGLQPDVNQYQSARHLTVAGADIYHPSQSRLTGLEIALGGDIARSLKGGNYLVMETQAQGYPDWTPYKGQLRLQAFSHIASGAGSVLYWHWHSLHNAVETYWKGLLSHDFEENETYLEACQVGREFEKLGGHLINLEKKNDAAILLSHEALTALKWFGIKASAAGHGDLEYNDVVRFVYQTLFHMNVECDILWPESENIESYKAVIVPALYAVPDSLLERLCQYVENGGRLFVTFKSAFANENVKVSHKIQPHILTKCLGVKYNQFAFPDKVRLSGSVLENAADSDLDSAQSAKDFMELLTLQGAQPLAVYEHSNWKGYAAITRNDYGKGSAYYMGCMADEAVLRNVFTRLFKEAGIFLPPEYEAGVAVKNGVNQEARNVHFYLNYSDKECHVPYIYKPGADLLTREAYGNGARMRLSPWGVRIVEES